MHGSELEVALDGVLFGITKQRRRMVFKWLPPAMTVNRQQSEAAGDLLVFSAAQPGGDG